MVEDWRDTVSAMALEAQTEAENLMWVTRTTSDDDDDDVEHASCSSGPSRPEQSSKRKQKAKAKRQTQRRGGIAQEKGGRVVKKYAVNFEGRRLQAIEGSDFVEGEDGKRVYDLTKVLSAATAALHTRDEAKLTELKEQCAAIARDNGAPVKTEEDAQAWVQDVLCKAYTARTLMRKLKGWKVQ